ncbi:hypothetical protein P280DRAFT_543917 [Massarina eburnea CBS 473.64]|uniref:Peptidase M43 pregnancy-associated plasma-A domain-containing protein n=1 Tax=Massarina eburnea CBS 473.64 TaxID=1395130 RepID=A0A6A6S475_9PLEO|nr:hypothetical protein P280DRAFT_543917 [Massarina eburnea CBS 473.64]
MIVGAYLLASLGALAHLITATPGLTRPKFDCGTDISHASTDFLSTLESLHYGTPSSGGSPAARAASSLSPLAPRNKDNNSAITVDTVFHIVAKQSNKADITNDMPTAQLDALNTAYKPYNIQFNLLNVTWNTNDAWAVGEKDADTTMKKTLRQGSYRTLNIFFQTDLAGGVLGRCTLPSQLSANAKGDKADRSVYANDGCNVNANTMPEGSLDEYNSGMTAVHEAGHWLGLLHTFEGLSCEGPGDYIDDTPQEKEATDGCPVGKSTCPGKNGAGGADPIHNFMDYSNDGCYEGFTGLQRERMHFLFNGFRDGN